MLEMPATAELFGTGLAAGAFCVACRLLISNGTSNASLGEAIEAVLGVIPAVGVDTASGGRVPVSFAIVAARVPLAIIGGIILPVPLAEGVATPGPIAIGAMIPPEPLAIGGGITLPVDFAISGRSPVPFTISVGAGIAEPVTGCGPPAVS